MKDLMIKRLAALTTAAVMTLCCATTALAAGSGTGAPGVQPGQSGQAVSAGVQGGSAQGARPDLQSAATQQVTAQQGGETSLPAGTEAPAQPGNGEKPGDGNLPGNGGAPMLNADEVSAQIEALEDGDAKTALEELLDSYKEALEEEKTVLDDADSTDDEKAAAREAVQTALDELTAALEDAGIEAPAQPGASEAQDADGTAPSSGNGFGARMGAMFGNLGNSLSENIGSLIKSLMSLFSSGAGI